VSVRVIRGSIYLLVKDNPRNALSDRKKDRLLLPSASMADIQAEPPPQCPDYQPQFV